MKIKRKTLYNLGFLYQKRNEFLGNNEYEINLKGL